MNNPITSPPAQPLWRKRTAWLALIPATVILCLAATTQPQSGQGYHDSNAPQLEGSWLVTVTQDTGTFESPVSYCAGGTMIGSDTSVYPLFPMTTAIHGTWARKGGREFVFTAMLFQYDNGLWKYVIKETVTIERGGDAYDGVGTVDVYDPEGTLVVTIPDSTHAIRIKAE